MSQLTLDEKKELLLLARSVIESELFGSTKIQPDLSANIFTENKGTFVTIHKNGKLRGCIGIIEAINPLAAIVKRMTKSSAFSDPRFRPLQADEYPQIDIEISVLSPTFVAQSPDEVEVGKHGIIISYGNRKGLLLPQVATENNWDKETFLNHTCLKAGLDKNMWQKGAIIELFAAEVFGELELND